MTGEMLVVIQEKNDKMLIELEINSYDLDATQDGL